MRLADGHDDAPAGQARREGLFDSIRTPRDDPGVRNRMRGGCTMRITRHALVVLAVAAILLAPAAAAAGTISPAESPVAPSTAPIKVTATIHVGKAPAGV